MRSSLLDRLVGVALTVFVVAGLMYGAARLVEAVWPILTAVLVVAGLAAGVVWWLRGRSGGW